VFSYAVAIVLGRKPSSNLRRIHSGRALATALVSRARLSRRSALGRAVPRFERSLCGDRRAATLALGTWATRTRPPDGLPTVCAICAAPGESYSDVTIRVARSGGERVQ
jgi:hypothetical protein